MFQISYHPVITKNILQKWYFEPAISSSRANTIFHRDFILKKKGRAKLIQTRVAQRVNEEINARQFFTNRRQRRYALRFGVTDEFLISRIRVFRHPKGKTCVASRIIQ